MAQYHICVYLGHQQNHKIFHWCPPPPAAASYANALQAAIRHSDNSSITWTADVDERIVRMRMDDTTFAKIASKLGNGLKENDIRNRWHRHLKVDRRARWGSIVRCITRLDELFREIRNCAQVIGNPTSDAIKRDIVFASSLYVS
jgi:hypothetical protein